MNVNLISSIFGEQGTTGVIVICFVSLVFWTVKKNDKMQDKLYSIIETLSRELPEIRETLDDLKKTIEEERKK